LNAVPKVEESHYRLLSIPGLPPDLSKALVGCRFADRCPRVQPGCRTTEPPLLQVGGSTSHEFACFHPVHGVEENREIRVATAQVDFTDAPIQLELSHVVKLFPVRSNALFRRHVGDVHALSDVSLTVRRGETFGLVGESGCGKTTTGKLIAGLEFPTSGAVLFEGADIYALRRRERRHARRNIQMVFQDPYSSLNPRQRVGSILEEPLSIQGEGSSRERKTRVLEMLDLVGISRNAVDRYPHEFSGGQRQRIGLARAITLRPKMLVADEPVSALDVSIQAQILNLIKDLQVELNLSLLMISHDLGVIRYMADTVGVMYLGKIVEIAPSDELYRAPSHPYTKGLLDSVPKPLEDLGKAELVHVQGELPSPIHPPSGCRFRTRCPNVQELCAEVEPVFRQFGENHYAACHFPLRTPVTIGSQL
jgi:oligopeptide/dipeptide ABC transporter ATP-binding protein